MPVDSTQRLEGGAALSVTNLSADREKLQLPDRFQVQTTIGVFWEERFLIMTTRGCWESVMNTSDEEAKMFINSIIWTFW